MRIPDTSAGAVWHALDGEKVLRHLDTDAYRGLSAREARQRLNHHGLNALPEPPAQPA